MLARLILLVIIVIIAFAIKRQLGRTKHRSPHSNSQSQDSTVLSRKEALYILGLTDPTSREEVLQAYKRLINKVHPDKGGTDFFASQLNLAREVLLDSNAAPGPQDREPKE